MAGGSVLIKIEGGGGFRGGGVGGGRALGKYLWGAGGGVSKYPLTQNYYLRKIILK